MKRFVLSGLLMLLMAVPLAAAHADGAGHRSKYAGQETRAIKGLSADDMDELRRGGGWGLAKPAELNGVPGPAHLLELKDDIPLTAAQVTRIESLHAAMTEQAIVAGRELIRLEAELDAGFRERRIDAEMLRRLLGDIEAVRRDLRYIHLSTHLQTPAILSDDQIARYNALRGYTRADPCAAVPQGHDPEMWRRHNGCG